VYVILSAMFVLPFLIVLFPFPVLRMRLIDGQPNVVVVIIAVRTRAQLATMNRGLVITGIALVAHVVSPIVNAGKVMGFLS
jgi:hypothetical protein